MTGATLVRVDIQRHSKQGPRHCGGGRAQWMDIARQLVARPCDVVKLVCVMTYWFVRNRGRAVTQ